MFLLMQEVDINPRMLWILFDKNFRGLLEEIFHLDS
jgi:hypothetical protein